MEGISKEILESIDSWDYETPQQLIMDIIDKCKELPDQQQWQTIDEFKNSGFVGLCWVFNNHGHVLAHNYDREYFLNPYMPNYPIHNNRIHGVMPIKTPEAPK